MGGAAGAAAAAPAPAAEAAAAVAGGAAAAATAEQEWERDHCGWRLPWTERRTSWQGFSLLTSYLFCVARADLCYFIPT